MHLDFLHFVFFSWMKDYLSLYISSLRIFKKQMSKNLVSFSWTQSRLVGYVSRHTPTNLWSSIIFCCTSEMYSLVFLIMMKGIWALFSLIFIFLWNRKPWLDNVMFTITLECTKLWIWMGIYVRDILLIRMSRGANNCVQCVLNFYLFHNDISLHFKLNVRFFIYIYIYIYIKDQKD